MEAKKSAVLNKLDALLHKHRGGKGDADIPILTELDAGPSADNIPTLTNVATSADSDFDLLFSAEEILGETGIVPAGNRDEPAPQPAPVAPPPTDNRPTLLFDFEHAIDVPDIGASVSSAPVADESRSFATTEKPSQTPAAPQRAAPSPGFLPELSFGFDAPIDSPPTISVPTPSPAPAPAQQSAPKPAQIPLQAPPTSSVSATPAADLEPHFGDLTIEFDDISLPPAKNTSSATKSRPSEKPPSTEFLPFEITLDISEPIGAPALHTTPPVENRIEDIGKSTGSGGQTSLMGQTANTLSFPDAQSVADSLTEVLRPELQRMVRTELSRQVATLHQAAVKATIAALTPELDRLICEHVAKLLKDIGLPPQA